MINFTAIYNDWSGAASCLAMIERSKDKFQVRSVKRVAGEWHIGALKL